MTGPGGPDYPCPLERMPPRIMAGSRERERKRERESFGHDDPVECYRLHLANQLNITIVPGVCIRQEIGLFKAGRLWTERCFVFQYYVFVSCPLVYLSPHEKGTNVLSTTCPLLLLDLVHCVVGRTTGRRVCGGGRRRCWCCSQKLFQLQQLPSLL
jgi:hypothetical protein